MTGPETLVTFAWDGETWGFPVGDVVEVAAARRVTPVPGLAPCMAGIVTWRGRSIAVILPRRLKADAAAPEVKSRFLVVRADAPFAVPIDEPGRVVPRESLEWPPLPGEGEPPPCGAPRIVRAGAIAIRVLDPTALAECGGVPADEEGSAD